MIQTFVGLREKKLNTLPVLCYKMQGKPVFFFNCSILILGAGPCSCLSPDS